METKSLHEQEDNHGEILPSFVLVHNDNHNSVV